MSEIDSKPITVLKAKNNVVKFDGGVIEQSLFSSGTKEHRIILGKSGSDLKNGTSGKLKLVQKE